MSSTSDIDYASDFDAAAQHEIDARNALLDELDEPRDLAGVMTGGDWMARQHLLEYARALSRCAIATSENIAELWIAAERARMRERTAN